MILPTISISSQKMSTIMMTAVMTGACSLQVFIYRQFKHKRVNLSGSRPMMMHMAAFTIIESVLR